MSLFSRLFSRKSQNAYHLGMQAYNAGDFEAAIESLELVLDSASKSSPIYVLSRFYVTHARVHLGLAYLEAERYDDAHTVFLEVIKRNPDFPDVHFHLGRIAERRSLWREAEMRFKRALLVNPAYREPRVALAVMYRHNGRHADAVEHAQALAESGLEIPSSWTDGTDEPDDAEMIEALRRTVRSPRGNTELVAEGMRLYQEGRLEESLQALTGAVETAPTHPDILCRKATVLAELGRFADAVEDLSKALEANPRYMEARLKRGVASFQLKRFLEASRDFRAVVEIEPTNSEARLLLGMSLFKADKITDAIDELTEAAAHKTTAGRAHYFLALAYIALERRDRAISVLTPIKLPTCRALLGRLYLETNRNAEAVAALREAIDGGMNTPDVHVTLARALYQAGRVDEARTKALAACEDAATRIAGALLLARMAFDAGQDEEALEHLSTIEQSASKDYDALVLRGRVLGRMERAGEAERALETALQVRPDGDEAKRALGLLWRRAGKPAASTMLGDATKDPADTLYGTQEMPRVEGSWKMTG